MFKVSAPITALVTVTAMTLSACTVGPEYHRTDPVMPEQYFQTSVQAETEPSTEHQFWQGFGDPLLADLVHKALASNHDLRVASARYQQSRAFLGAARQEWLPDLNAQGFAGEERSSAAQMPGVDRADRDTRRYELGLEAHWEVDFWGRFKRGVAIRRAEAQAAAQDLSAAQVAIVGELASSYYQLRGLQAQLKVALNNTDNQRDTLALVSARNREGRGTDFDVARAEALLQTSLSRIPAIESDIAVATHRIALLVGEQPGALIEELKAPGVFPPLTAEITVGMPAELLRRRPDILAAERRLASATERVGLVTADLFPRLSLSGLIGSQAITTDGLFERDSETRLFGVGLHWPILEMGRVRARIAAADAGALEHLALYEQTVLGALEETESALARFAHALQEQDYLQAAASAGRDAAGLARLRFEGGAADFLQVLDSERTQLEIEDRLAQSKMRAALAMVAIYRAVAGAWHDTAEERLIRKDGLAMSE